MTNSLSTLISRRPFAAIAILTAFACGAIAQTAPKRYTLILQDPPAVRQFQNARSPEAASYRQQIQAKHRALQAELAELVILRQFSLEGTFLTWVDHMDSIHSLSALPSSDQRTATGG